MGQVLDLTLYGTTEEREDRWAVKCLALGIIVYGETQEEAQGAFLGAVEALINSFYGDEEKLTTWLDLEKISYQLFTDDYEGVRLYELAVPDEQEYVVRMAVGAAA